MTSSWALRNASFLSHGPFRSHNSVGVFALSRHGLKSYFFIISYVLLWHISGGWVGAWWWRGSLARSKKCYKEMYFKYIHDFFDHLKQGKHRSNSLYIWLEHTLMRTETLLEECFIIIYSVVITVVCMLVNSKNPQLEESITENRESLWYNFVAIGGNCGCHNGNPGAISDSKVSIIITHCFETITPYSWYVIYNSLRPSDAYMRR